MSDDRQLTGALRSWLREEEHEDADRVLFAVLDQLDATPQRRPFLPARRTLIMQYATRIVAAAAIVIAIGAGVYLVAGSPNGNGGQVSSPTPSPTVAATPTPTPSQPASPSAAALVRQTISAADGGPAIAFDSGSGWTNIGFAAMTNAASAPNGFSISVWQIATVYLDPCHWQTSDTADSGFLRTQAGVGEALALWGADSTTPDLPNVTAPSEVTFAGQPATYVEYTVPSDISFADCDGGRYVPWLDPSGEQRYQQGPGQREQIWVLATNGAIFEVVASSFPDTTSAAKLAELQAAIDSVEILPSS